MFGISPMQLIIILVIVVLLFGTKKLRSLGGDLGSAVKGFKKAVSDKDEDNDADFKDDTSKEVEDKSPQLKKSPDDVKQVDKTTESKAK